MGTVQRWSDPWGKCCQMRKTLGTSCSLWTRALLAAILLCDAQCESCISKISCQITKLGDFTKVGEIFDIS